LYLENIKLKYTLFGVLICSIESVILKTA
jgi:hypothetical protein